MKRQYLVTFQVGVEVDVEVRDIDQYVDDDLVLEIAKQKLEGTDLAFCETDEIEFQGDVIE